MPVLRRPRVRPADSSVRERPSAGASPTRPAGILRLADMDQAAEEGAGRQDDGAGRDAAAVAGDDAGGRRFSMIEVVGFGGDDGRGSGSSGAAPACAGGRACGRPGRGARGPRGPSSGSAGGIGCRRRRPPAPSTPSSASISRTRCPLPRPPMAGLQDISPSVSRACGSRARSGRRARAAAAAASQPAWPPPITMTSKVEAGLFMGGLIAAGGNVPRESLRGARFDVLQPEAVTCRCRTRGRSHPAGLRRRRGR